MDVRFVKTLRMTRKRLIKNELQISDIVAQKAKYQAFATEVISQWQNHHSIANPYRDMLIEFLMICMDVYTYSDMGEVLVSDWTYDQVMNIYMELMQKPRIQFADYLMSTTIWPFAKHEAPFMVGTINCKVYDIDTLAAWLEQRKREGYTRILYAPKFDGISVCVTIRNGIIVKAMTRNNGVEGQDITEVVRKMNRHKKIFGKDTPDGYYKCELVVTTEDYNELVLHKPYANRRSAASAIISTPSNLAYAEYITAIMLAWVDFEGYRMKYLAWTWVNDLVRHPESFVLDDVYDNIERILGKIRGAEFPIRVDGVVLFPIFTADDAPNTVDLMACSLAYKVNTQEARTRVKYVYMSVGRMGKGMPMAKVYPAEVNETIVQDVSLGSMSMFASRCIHENEEVIVIAAGDVIPYLKMPEERHYPQGAKRLQIDLRCPYCGKKLRPKTGDDKNVYCLNPSCPRVLSGKIANFLDKMEIADGYRDATFLTLVEKGLMTTIEDLFTLHTKLNQVADAIGSLVEAEKLMDGLSVLRTETFEVSKVFGALGIPNIAQKTCQAIFRDMTLDYLLSMKKTAIYMAVLGTPGMGDATARTFAEWMMENRDLIDTIMENMQLKDDGIAWGTVCFTGFRNKVYADMLKDIGFPTSDRVSKDTVAVVYSGNLQTGNARKALTKNIPLIHVGEIDKLIDSLRDLSDRYNASPDDYSLFMIVREIRGNCPVYTENSIE